MSSKHIKKISHSYSLYVAQNRAIPSVIDGLKHGQRMALWSIRNKTGKIKTMALTGALLAEKIYVHGDVSANNTISLLAAPFKNNVPLITGHGFFGSRVAPGEMGAPRYTDVSKSVAAERFLYVDADHVPLKENYDGSTMEPVHFLPLIPTVLLNGVAGVAVGYSTEILPRNLGDLIAATQAVLIGKKFTEPMPSYERYNVKVKLVGPNQWEIAGAATIKDTSTIIVTELPPGLSLEAFKKRLIQMEDEDKITNFNDNSSDSINIEIQMKRGSVKGWTEQQAIDFFKIREKVTERIVVVDWNGESIATYPDATTLIKDFVNWRLAYYEHRYQKYHDDDTHELQYWKLLRALFKAGFTKKLGTFADRNAVESDVTEVAVAAKIKTDDSHIDRAVSLPTYRWTKKFEAEVAEKIKELEGKIKEYKAILRDPEKRRAIYVNELDALKKMKLGEIA